MKEYKITAEDFGLPEHEDDYFWDTLDKMSLGGNKIIINGRSYYPTSTYTSSDFSWSDTNLGTIVIK